MQRTAKIAGKADGLECLLVQTNDSLALQIETWNFGKWRGKKEEEEKTYY